MNSPELQRRESILESGHAYAAGRQAFRDGAPNTDNPHPRNRGKSRSRTLWFYGWYDERNKRFHQKET